MIDLDDDLLVDLFNLFFNVASDEPSKKKVATLMVEILASLIEDCRTIPQALLESILQNLVPAKKKENISAYNLAVNLLNKSPNLIPPFAQFFSDTNTESKHSELKEYAHDLILELNQISPKLVETVLPQIEEELQSADQKLRKGAVEILGGLFSKNISIATHNRLLLFKFLERLNDIDVSIRVAMIKLLKNFYNLPADIVTDINEKLLLKLNDTVPEVRVAAVSQICEIAYSYKYVIPHKLMDEVAIRLRDKKEEVKRIAAVSLVQLYCKICEYYENEKQKRLAERKKHKKPKKDESEDEDKNEDVDLDAWDTNDLEKFGWIPKK